MQGLLKFVSLL